MTRFFLSFFSLSAMLSLSAQEEQPEKKPRLKLYSAQAEAGMVLFGADYLSIDDMKKIAPGSAFLSRDLSGFAQPAGLAYAYSLHPVAAAHAEFVPFSKKKNAYRAHTTFRAGLQVNALEYYSIYVERNNYERYDTIQNTNGETIYLDTMRTYNYLFRWAARSIGIHVAQVFRTKECGVLSGWIGYGLQAGICYDARFSGHYSEYERTVYYRPAYDQFIPTYNYFEYTSDYESLRMPATFFGRVYIPLGFQVRFGRAPKLLSCLAATFECRTGIDLTQPPGLGLKARPGVAGCIGLKYFFKS